MAEVELEKNENSPHTIGINEEVDIARIEAVYK